MNDANYTDFDGIADFDSDLVDRPQPWYLAARQAWAAAADRYSTGLHTSYRDPEAIYDVLKAFTNMAGIYSASGFDNLRGIDQGESETVSIDAGGFTIATPIKEVTLVRAGLAKWNTWLLVQFAVVPERWTKHFPNGGAWLMITSQTSAFTRYRKWTLDTAYKVGPLSLERLFTKLDSRIDSIIVDVEPWPKP